LTQTTIANGYFNGSSKGLWLKYDSTSIHHFTGVFMNDTVRQVMPVIVSILIIIAVAVLRQYSRTLAAILATMPINIPLSIWIIYTAENGDKSAMTDYTQTLLWGLIPAFVFIGVTWLAFRAGWNLTQTVGVGYVVWALALGVLLLIRGMVNGAG
jgi:hypothetical protein